MDIATLQFDEDYLYLSKESDLRQRLLLDMQEVLAPISQTSILEQFDDIMQSIKKLPHYSKFNRQLSYCIVDITLVTMHNLHSTQDIFEQLTGHIRPYIVLHELAAYSWGGGKIEPPIIFDLIATSDLSDKHRYHLLNEMSLTFPKQTISFVRDQTEAGNFQDQIYDKLATSMVRARTRSKSLSKGIIPKLTAEEIRGILNRRGK